MRHHGRAGRRAARSLMQLRRKSASARSKGDKDMEPVVQLCLQRGFCFPSSELYGGLSGAYDYGPLGSQLKKTLSDMWWRDFVELRHDCVGVDTPIVLNPGVWRASGHVDNFTDPLVECKTCQHRARADKLVEDRGEVAPQDLAALGALVQQLGVPCPSCGARDAFTAPHSFNLLFRTEIGAMAGSSAEAFLRPETAQGAFVAFKRVLATCRKKLPFGVGQMGRAFRNEISPGQFLFRTREFEQLELQYFTLPEEAAEHYGEWVDRCHRWLTDRVGLRPESVRRRQHEDEELAHYATATTDLEFRYPFGWGELWGVANRGSSDLDVHAAATGDSLDAPHPTEEGKRVRPHVIEPSLGLGRLVLATLCDAYGDDQVPDRDGKLSSRKLLRLKPELAPYRAAVLPLLKSRPDQVAFADDVFQRLATRFRTELDLAGSIGKRYRRQDEIGTPVCVTVDPGTMEDGLVTVRDRDTTLQRRVVVDEAIHCVERGTASPAEA